MGKMQRMGLLRRGPGPSDPADLMADSPNPAVKSKALQFDVSPAELLRPCRFSWEDATP